MGMKDSGIQWIGQIPEEWEVCRIKDKYKLITGFTPDTTRDDFYDDENGYTWISIADMTKEGKEISESVTRISDVYVKSKHPEIVKKGSLLYSFKLSVGKVGFAQKELYTNEAIASFQENDDICLDYLYYAAFLIEENANINIYGAKILNQDLINNSITIIPPLAEQQLIACFLDDKVRKIDDILCDLNKQVDILEKYKKSLITETVTKGLNPDVSMKDSGIDWIGMIPEDWEDYKVKYSLELLTDYDANGSFETIAKNVIPNTGEPYAWMVRATDLENNNIGMSDVTNYCDEKTYKFLSKSSLCSGDLIMAKRGGIGNVYVLPTINEPATLAPNTYLLRFDEDINTKYMYYIFKSHFGMEQLRLINKSTTIGAIYKDDVKSIKFAKPTLEEQEKIAEFLDKKCAQIDEIISDKKTQIEKMENYKKSLIYEYVTGKKRVKGVV